MIEINIEERIERLRAERVSQKRLEQEVAKIKRSAEDIPAKGEPAEAISTEFTSLVSRFVIWSSNSRIEPDHTREIRSKYELGLFRRLLLPSAYNNIRAWRLRNPIEVFTTFPGDPESKAGCFGDSVVRSVVDMCGAISRNSEIGLFVYSSRDDCNTPKATQLSEGLLSKSNIFLEFSEANSAVIDEISKRVSSDDILDEVARLALDNGLRTDNF